MPTNLKPGDKAPSFSAPSWDGSTVKLSDFSGDRNVVLFFYSRDNTSGCTREARALRDAAGKLEKREAPNCEPDTYLFLWDKDDNIVAQDNDSSSLGNGKASAVYGAVPIANGDSPGGTVRIGLTGRPDGIDGHFNGLFFNAAHQQIGEATVYVTYYDGMGVMLGMDSYVADFKTGLDQATPLLRTCQIDVILRLQGCAQIK